MVRSWSIQPESDHSGGRQTACNCRRSGTGGPGSGPGPSDGAAQQAAEADPEPVPALPAGRAGQAGLRAADPRRVPRERRHQEDGLYARGVSAAPRAAAAGAAEGQQHQATGLLLQARPPGRVTGP